MSLELSHSVIPSVVVLLFNLLTVSSASLIQASGLHKTYKYLLGLIIGHY